MTDGSPRRMLLGGRERPVDLTFLDCDGVIFDSNSAKLRAFAGALAEYPKEAVERLLQIHRAEGGVSRYVKMRRFFEELHPVDDPEPAIERALARFGELSVREYARLSPRREALEFIARMGGPDAAVVVSGSDQDELRRVFDSQGLGDRVADVLGSPTKKPEHLRRVLAERGVPPERALFVGDGKGDLDAAQEVGVPFVFLAEMSEWEDGRTIVGACENAWIAESWAELSSWIV